MRCKPLEFIVRLLGRAEGHEFDLVELMLPDQPASVLSVRPCFPPEAWGIGGISQGKALLAQSLFAMKIRYRHFRGGDEKIIFVLQPKQIVFEFRELSRAGHARTIHEKRREDLSIAMLLGMKIQHEIDQGP